MCQPFKRPDISEYLKPRSKMFVGLKKMFVTCCLVTVEMFVICQRNEIRSFRREKLACSNLGQSVACCHSP